MRRFSFDKRAAFQGKMACEPESQKTSYEQGRPGAHTRAILLNATHRMEPYSFEARRSSGADLHIEIESWLIEISRRVGVDVAEMSSPSVDKPKACE